jgi:hypothetical protein
MTKIKSPDASGGRRSNQNTALILLSVALVFFAGVIAKYWFSSGG